MFSFDSWVFSVLNYLQELTDDPQFIVGGATRTDICQGALGKWIRVRAGTVSLCAILFILTSRMIRSSEIQVLVIWKSNSITTKTTTPKVIFIFIFFTAGVLKFLWNRRRSFITDTKYNPRYKCSLYTEYDCRFNRNTPNSHTQSFPIGSWARSYVGLITERVFQVFLRNAVCWMYSQ